MGEHGAQNMMEEKGLSVLIEGQLRASLWWRVSGLTSVVDKMSLCMVENFPHTYMNTDGHAHLWIGKMLIR